jgi:phosphoglycerate dehydrogenase-like enzyme
LSKKWNWLMALLLPETDGVADAVRQRLPQARVLGYGQAGREQLAEVTFYCLPYMGGADSVALIADLPRLAVVQTLSSGVDDVIGAVPPGAVLCNGRGLGHEDGTAELAVTLILASLRRIGGFVAHQARGDWRHSRTEALAGKRVLLVGQGEIGAGIEQRLAPFGVQISRVSRTAREGVAGLSELARLAAATDICVICIALHPQTRHLIGRDVLAALPDGALVVNVARGKVVDAAALAAELAAGRLRAALDVTDVEPLPAGREEWTLPNVLITPHIGGDTFTFAERAPEFVAGQAARFLAGQPLANVVRGG